MNLREELQKTLGDAYTLEQELGGGGMSRVFVATETVLLKLHETNRLWTQQARATLVEMCSWRKGTYAWHPGRESPLVDVPLAVNMFEMLGAAAMALGDGAAGAWAASHGSVKLVATRTPRVDPDRFEVAGLSTVLESLDGSRSVDEIAETHADRQGRSRCLRMLLLLEACECAVP